MIEKYTIKAKNVAENVRRENQRQIIVDLEKTGWKTATKVAEGMIRESGWHISLSGLIGLTLKILRVMIDAQTEEYKNLNVQKIGNARFISPELADQLKDKVVEAVRALKSTSKRNT